MKQALKLYKDNIKYIENSFKYDNNNGIIEGTNNLIKCIKRIAFGYRKYDNFISRIFLIKGIIKGGFSSSFIINSFIKFIVHQHYLTIIRFILVLYFCRPYLVCSPALIAACAAASLAIGTLNGEQETYVRPIS